MSKGEPTGKEIKKNLTDKTSKAKRINRVFLKYQKWFKTEYETTNFKEPVLFLHRRNGIVEPYEDATRGLFNFTHSDGTSKFIILTGRPPTWGFGKRAFDAYYVHEDHPTPLPSDPLINTEQMNICIEKALNDYQEWQSKQKIAVGTMWWYILGGIAVIIIALAFFYLLKPTTQPVKEIQTVVQIINASGGVL